MGMSLLELFSAEHLILIFPMLFGISYFSNDSAMMSCFEFLLFSMTYDKYNFWIFHTIINWLQSHIYISIYDRVGTKSGEENNSDLTGSVSALLINLLLDEEENLFGSFGKV